MSWAAAAGVPQVRLADRALGVGAMQGVLSVKAIAAGGDRSLALASDGTVWEWGATRGPTPVQVAGLTGVVRVAAGNQHSLAVKGDGSVWAWGSNAYGQLGDGTTTDRPTPVQVSGLSGVVAVAAGWQYSLAIKGDGTVWEWGGVGASPGQRTAPVQVSGLTGVVAVAAGGFCLALKGDGTVWQWGSPLPPPVQISGLSGVVAIAAGYGHSLAVKGDGTVWQWPGYLSAPAQVSELSGVVAAGGGSRQSLAVKGDGTVWEWRMSYPPAPPVQVGGISGVVAVAGGETHSLALSGDGTLWAWGDNRSGQLGDGGLMWRSTPGEVSGLSAVAAIAGKYSRNLAVKRDGTVWQWGQDSPTAVPTSGLSGVVAVAAGLKHSLAMKGEGTVWAWGDNGGGQLGDGTTVTRSTPGQVGGLAGVVAIQAGRYPSLALKDDGTVWQWGLSGKLGEPLTAPIRVSGIGRVVTVAAGGNHGLALQEDGTLWAWGTNWAGQLGEGTIAEQQKRPVPVLGLSGIMAIAAGSAHSLAVKSDGTVWAWGLNRFGELGDGTTTQRLTPVQVSGLTEVVAVAGGGGAFGAHSLALRRDGTVWAWGSNSSGQLGDGTTTDRLTAVRVAGLSEVAAIVAGQVHSLVLKRDGTVWAWGSNSSGQLGDGRMFTRSTPVQVVPPGSPDLAIAMNHASDFAVGDQGVYTLTITNAGLTATAGEITVTDTLPPGLAYLSATGTGWFCSAAGQTVTCTNAGPINPGSSTVITLTLNVGWAAWPGVTNLATVSNASDRNIANNAMSDPTVVLPAPVVVNAVVNAASFRAGPIAPGELVTVFGKEMGPATGVSENTLGQTRVLFDGVAAPVLFARADQVTAVAPYALAGKRSTELQVEYRGVKSSPLAVAVAESAPGVFTANASGTGQAAILNEDGSPNSASKPARRGSMVTVFATGEGQASSRGPVLPLTLLIGGLEAPVYDAAPAPGLVGVLQVKAWVPGPIAPGPAVPITLVVGGARSQSGVTVAVQ